MTERYDVVVVGARCAGATVAANLARAGLSVAVLDRSRFGSDTLSTHFFQTPAFAALEHLGLLTELCASGAPFLTHIDYAFGDLVRTDPVTGPDGGPDALSVRRTVLDAAVSRAAAAAGAEVRHETRVTGLLYDDGRVAGVSAIDRAGRSRDVEATLVVGADGMGSTVGRLVGARRYHVVANERFCYWGYFEGVAAQPATLLHQFDEELSIGFPCDGGLYTAIVLPPLDRLAAFAEDLDGAFNATVAQDEAFADLLNGGRRVGPLRGMAKYPAYFRESAGPGWVLVGDAGHFKDPASGQGISDAFLQAERLAQSIIGAVGGEGLSIDQAMQDWWAWRDAEEWDMHWLAADLGAAGRVPVVVVEALRQLADSPEGLAPFWHLFHRHGKPSQVLTPELLHSASRRLAGTVLEAQAQEELAALEAVAAEREALALHPRYEPERYTTPAAPHMVRRSQARGSLAQA